MSNTKLKDGQVRAFLLFLLQMPSDKIPKHIVQEARSWHTASRLSGVAMVACSCTLKWSEIFKLTLASSLSDFVYVAKNCKAGLTLGIGEMIVNMGLQITMTNLICLIKHQYIPYERSNDFRLSTSHNLEFKITYKSGCVQ